MPLARQATSTTSLIFLVVAVFAIAASVFLFVRYGESQRKFEEMRKGGQGGTSRAEVERERGGPGSPPGGM